MTGYVDYADVPEVYRRADIFVSPTYAEGFSNTILEAMASGLAVVSCRAVGVVDCIRDGENGLLTEPGDVPALTAALRRVLPTRPSAAGWPRPGWRSAGASIPGSRRAADHGRVRSAGGQHAGSATGRWSCRARPAGSG